MPQKRESHNQRYGSTHKGWRKYYARLVEAGGVKCWRCGKPILPGSRWDLGHTDFGDRRPEHLVCNRRDGGQKRAEQLYGKRYRNSGGLRGKPRFDGLPDPDPDNRVTRWSRHWSGPFNPRCPRCRALRGPCEDAETGEAA